MTDAELDLHHAVPQSWPLALSGAQKKVPICCVCHRRTHRLLNAYVHAGGVPSRSVLAQFRPIEIELAAYAWANADHSGPNHLPYTLEQGDVPHG